jgi:hypothetical protein
LDAVELQIKAPLRGKALMIRFNSQSLNILSF